MTRTPVCRVAIHRFFVGILLSLERFDFLVEHHVWRLRVEVEPGGERGLFGGGLADGGRALDLGGQFALAVRRIHGLSNDYEHHGGCGREETAERPDDVLPRANRVDLGDQLDDRLREREREAEAVFDVVGGEVREDRLRLDPLAAEAAVEGRARAVVAAAGLALVAAELELRTTMILLAARRCGSSSVMTSE